MKHKIALIFLVFTCQISQSQPIETVIKPEHYICYRASKPLVIDGRLDEAEWQQCKWTKSFVDIEGLKMPLPRFDTKVKMLWDSNYLYIAAQMEEPHVWATLTQRESVIFYDNDFEVFIDPDGDTHNYLEFEMNALNTQWDLLLLKPYRDAESNVAIDNWNFNGIISAVHINGTLNNPNDIDKGWSIEIAIPFDAIIEVGNTGKLPIKGEQYRINFSRVEWEVDVVDNKYIKRKHIVNGIEKTLPEANWVWSAQGVIAMHQPETWGYVQFSDIYAGQGSDSFIDDTDFELKMELRRYYYAQKSFFQNNKKYATTLHELAPKSKLFSSYKNKPKIMTTSSGYETIVLSNNDKDIIHITHDGRIWKTNK